MGTALFSTAAIRDSTEAAANSIGEQFGSSFKLQVSVDNAANTFRGNGIISQDSIDQVSAVEGIAGHVKQAGAMALLPGSGTVPLAGFSEYDEQLRAKYGDFAQIEGSSDTSKNSKFTMESLKLKQGRHITGTDSHAALIHEEFAKRNNLKVGDTFTLAASQNDRGNKHKSKATVKVAVAGIFSGENARPAAMRPEMYENIILTDLKTIQDIYQLTPADEAYSQVDFTLKPGYGVSSVMEKVKALPLDWKRFAVTGNDGDLVGVSSSISGIFGMVKTMLVLTIVFSTTVLTLVLFLWLNGRRREAAVMVSVGVGKPRVVGQFLTELALISLPAFALSLVTGSVLAQAIGNKMASASSQASKRDVLQQSNGMLGADAESSFALKTIDHIFVQARPEYLLQVFGIGLAIIAFAVLISSVPLLRSSPKQLLAKNR